MTSPRPELVIAVWDDAWVDGSDAVVLGGTDEKHRPTVMQTIGWLVTSDQEGISLFNERCLDKGEEYYRSRTFIPRPLIKSVTPFTLTRRRTRKVPDEAAAPAVTDR